MKDLFFSKLKFMTCVTVILSGLLILCTVLDGGKTSLLPILAFSAFSIGTILVSVHQYRKEVEDSAGFRRTKPTDARDFREAMIDGVMGLCMAATVLFYGRVAEKIVAVVIAVIIVRLMAYLYKCYKECKTNG